MKSIVYSIEQIYNDPNIKIKPYPFCPKCKKPIQIEINIIYEIEYEIKCTCNHYVYIRGKNLNNLIQSWNQHCTDEINDSYATVIHNNIFLISGGMIAVTCSLLAWFNVLTLPVALIAGAIAANSPTLLSLLTDSKIINEQIKEKIINKVIDNYMQRLPINEEINIQEEIHNLDSLIHIMANIQYKYFTFNNDKLNNLADRLNKLIAKINQIYTFYIEHFNFLDVKYINVLQEFNTYITLIDTNYKKYHIVQFIPLTEIVLIGICESSSDIKEKNIVCSNFSLNDGNIFMVTFKYDCLETDNILFNVNNTGLKKVNCNKQALLTNHVYTFIYSHNQYTLVNDININNNEINNYNLLVAFESFFEQRLSKIQQLNLIETNKQLVQINNNLLLAKN